MGDRWVLVAVAGALSFVAMLDMNIVNVALADIAAGLHVPAATAQWAALGYQLPFVALLLPVGRLLDGAGTRPALLAATAGFALCSVLAALAPGAAWLIAARTGQGVCAAVLFVLMPVLAIRAVRPTFTGTRSALQRDCRRRAYGVIQRSRAWGGLVADHHPRAVRLSIHPQPAGAPKFGIRLLDGPDAWTTPWHSAALRQADGTWTLMPRARAQRLGRLVHRDGRPSHFERSRADDQRFSATVRR